MTLYPRIRVLSLVRDPGSGIRGLPWWPTQWESDDHAAPRTNSRPIANVISQWHLPPVAMRGYNRKCQRKPAGMLALPVGWHLSSPAYVLAEWVRLVEFWMSIWRG